MPQSTTTTFESHYALAHQVFWTALADRYRAKQTIKSVFIADVIMDWLFDVNINLDSIDEVTVLMTWGTPTNYDRTLLDSLLNPKDYLRGIKDLYRQHKAEIKAELGNRPLDEIDDFSNDYYLAYGFTPRVKHHRK